MATHLWYGVFFLMGPTAFLVFWGVIRLGVCGEAGGDTERHRTNQ